MTYNPDAAHIKAKTHPHGTRFCHIPYEPFNFLCFTDMPAS
jgi:hypothetical protein